MSRLRSGGEDTVFVSENRPKSIPKRPFSEREFLNDSPYDYPVDYNEDGRNLAFIKIIW
jgi:hypothetical protein